MEASIGMRAMEKAIAAGLLALLVLATSTPISSLLSTPHARKSDLLRPSSEKPLSLLMEIPSPDGQEGFMASPEDPIEPIGPARFSWPPERSYKELALLGLHREGPPHRRPTRPIRPAQDVPSPSSSDIVITGEEMWVDQVIVLTSNLIIEGGGSLTLINTTLIMNCACEGEYHIVVKPGGELHITQGSNITASDLDAPFTFLVRPGSVFEMRDSELHGCGYGGEHPGLVVMAEGAVLEGCLISHNFYGISLVGGNATLKDCVITANYKGLYCEMGASLRLDGCSVTGNAWEGVDAWDSTLILSGCEITDNGQGVHCVGSALNITGCDISLNHGDGVSLMASQAYLASSTLNNNTGWGLSCDLSNATLTSCELSFNWLDGVDAYGGSYVVVEGCSISYNGLEGFWSGLSCQLGSGAEVRDCAIIGNGLDGVACEGSWISVENCEIADNYRFGIYVYQSSGVVVRNCTLIHDALFLEGYELAHFLHTVEDNTVNGAPLYYVVNSTGLTIGRPIGSLIVVNSHAITVFTGSLTEKINISRTDVAIEVAFSENIVLKSCYVDQNGWYGVYTYNSTVSVEHSIISRNGYGIYCAGGGQLTIHYCNIFANTGPGLYAEPPSSAYATENWWESEDGPEESETGDPDPPEEVWGNVNCYPWLNVPTCWADFDEDEIPNFLETPAFNVHVAVRSGTYKLVMVPNVVEFEFDWPVGVYVITPANSMEEMLSALGEWGVQPEGEVFFALPIVIDVGGLIGGFLDVLAEFLPHIILTTTETQLMDQDGRFRLLIMPVFGIEIDYWDAMRLLLDLLVELKDLFTGGLTLEDVRDLLSLLDTYRLDIKFYLLFESVTYLSQGVWALDLRAVLDFIGRLSAMTRIAISIAAEVADALLSGIGLLSIVEELAEKIINLMLDYLSEWVPIFALAEEIVDYVRHLMGLVKMFFGFGDPPGVLLSVEVLKPIRIGDEVIYEPLLVSWGYNYTDGGLMLWDPHEYELLLSKTIFPLLINITFLSISGLGACEDLMPSQAPSMNYTLVIRDLQFDRTVVCGGSLHIGEHTGSLMRRDVATNQTLLSYLALNASFSSVRPHQGEEVEVYITVMDENGTIVPDADVSLTFGGRPVVIEQVGEGKFKAVLDTSGLYGLAVVRICAEKEGYFPGLVVQPIYVIDDIPPEVDVERPANASYVRGSVQISVSASDASGIDVVEVYANGTLLSADEEAPYELEWNTRAWPDGLINITALARDRAGNTAKAMVWVVVDNTPPTLRITAPGEGEVISADRVVVAWEVSDEHGIAKVELCVDGGAWLDVTDLESYELSGLGEGSHKVVIRATDVAGNTAEASVTFTVRFGAVLWPWAVLAGAVLAAVAISALIVRKARA